MSLDMSKVISHLAIFLGKEIRREGINCIVPLEAKGALLLDLVAERMPLETEKPRIFYRRGIEYLTYEERTTSKIAIIDDTLFTGRTISEAIEEIKEYGVPDRNIFPIAFFRFSTSRIPENVHLEIVNRTRVPTDVYITSLACTDVLREIRELATTHKIPPSYDNLEFDANISPNHYRRFMSDLAKTDCLLHYGKRGCYNASALILPASNINDYSSPPKIRFWYNEKTKQVKLTPISFLSPGKGYCVKEMPALEDILQSEYTAGNKKALILKSRVATLYSQVNQLSYIKSFLHKHEISLKVNDHHLQRYYATKTGAVINQIETSLEKLPDLTLPTKFSTPKVIPYYWLSIEIMRDLGELYLAQRTAGKPRNQWTSQGFTVSELIQKYSSRADEETVHAAVDYCADMNFIATFPRHTPEGIPTRAFRLTENGEEERISLVEKIGAYIIAKSPDQSVHWWVLEKVPAILEKTLGLTVPQMCAVKGFYGDVMQITPNEAICSVHTTWPKIREYLWKKEGNPGEKSTVFHLNKEKYELHKKDIIGDKDIIKMSGGLEAILELIHKSRIGHDGAVLIDILSDGKGGMTYIADGLQKMLSYLYDSYINNDKKLYVAATEWARGVSEKINILGKSDAILEKLYKVVQSLKKDLRGEQHENILNKTLSFPPQNTIRNSIEDISLNMRDVLRAVKEKDIFAIDALVGKLTINPKTETRETGMDTSLSRLNNILDIWSSAFAGTIHDGDYYECHQLKISQGETRKMYVVAYDLIGSTPGGRQEKDAMTENLIQSVISNWFIAFGSYAWHPQLGQGDLGFGFFDTPIDAIQASLWATYHLDLLSKTQKDLLVKTPPHAGFGIVYDELRSGFRDQVSSGELSRLAKAWKRDASRIAEQTGRKNLPAIAIKNDLFTIRQIPEMFLNGTGTLDNISVRFVNEAARSKMPWTKR